LTANVRKQVEAQAHQEIHRLNELLKQSEITYNEAAIIWQQQLSQTAAGLGSLIEGKKVMQMNFEARERDLLEHFLSKLIA
jgi:hypothetical protein